MKSTKTFILALTHHDYLKYLMKNNISRENTTFVGRIEYIKGCHRSKMVVVAGAEQRSDYTVLMEEAKVRNFEITEVEGV